MKNILITGADSYIGTSFVAYCTLNFPETYRIDTVDMRDPSWEGKDFSSYDCVFHVAGIAHAMTRKPTPEQEQQYRQVNTELAYKTACKAKADGVRQFVFMSTMAIFGDSAPIGRQKVITRDTPIAPSSVYGRSKAEAEELLRPLACEAFCLSIIRPPMVYGRGSKGNYPLLAKFADSLPLFPKVNNQRSMIYIENLCEFIRLVIDNEDGGTFHPQNAEYTNTSDMVAEIAKAHGKRIRLVRGFTWLLRLASLFTKLVNKAFGNLAYSEDISQYKMPYVRYSLEESIERSERA